MDEDRHPDAAVLPPEERMPPAFRAPEFVSLRKRLGEVLFRQRAFEQTHHAAGLTHQERGFQALQKFMDVDAAILRVARLLLLYRAGYRNFRDLRVVTHEIRRRRLPAGLEGFRILQISDLHLDLDPALTEAIVKKLRGLQYDLAVFTGDFRNSTDEDHGPSVQETLRLLPVFSAPLYGVLGNHDFLEIVPPLEAAGLRFLLNEAVDIRHNGDRFCLAGIDDPHFYKTHDLARVRQAIPEDVFSILLSHSPEVYRPASALGFDVLFCGHTHGGQICLPGGVALIRVCRVPARMLAGSWAYRGMRGYTSVGTGSCGVPLRFFCPPELTLHILRRVGDDSR